MCTSFISSGLLQPGRPGNKKIAMQHRGQKNNQLQEKSGDSKQKSNKYTECKVGEQDRKKQKGRNRNRGKCGIGESGIQLPVTTVGSMGWQPETNTHTLEVRLVQDKKHWKLLRWSLGERQEVCPCRAALEKVMAGRWGHLGLSGSWKSQLLQRFHYYVS